MRQVVTVWILVSILLSACSPAATPTPLPTATPVPTYTPYPTFTPLPTATLTPTATPTNTPEPTATPEPTNTPSPSPLPVPAYTASVEDISIGLATRFKVTVVTEFPISVEQINVLCEEVIEGVKDQMRFNAVAVFLYDTHSVVPFGYSIASCEYAPHGVWGEAVNVEAGNYFTHEFAYDYRPKVHDAQAALSERPTEVQHELCEQWYQLTDELLAQGVDDAEVDAMGYEQIGEKHGISSQAVKEAVYKCLFWAFK